MKMITASATTPVVARLRYDAPSPYAVMLVFGSEGANPIEWTFARELLAAGLSLPSGDGDVRVWPAEASEQVFLELRSPSGRAVFAAAAARLRQFLDLTEQIVPTGDEASLLDLDSGLCLLLHGESAEPRGLCGGCDAVELGAAVEVRDAFEAGEAVG